jgi:NAD(P)-dependent dehydrogenase (short-subunit alcohol dehydrogenase family)
MNHLDGKAALISGGARGIGAETARKMAAAGASFALGFAWKGVGRPRKPVERRFLPSLSFQPRQTNALCAPAQPAAGHRCRGVRKPCTRTAVQDRTAAHR